METLRTFDSELHGKGLKYGAGKKTDDYVQNWTRTNEFMSWPVRLTAAATYDVAVVYDAEEDSEGGGFAVKIGGQTLPGVVKAGKGVTTLVSRIGLEAGTDEIQLLAETIKGGELMRPKSLVLTEVK